MFFSLLHASSSARSIGAPGLVLHVQHARRGVRALERPVEAAVLAVERNLQLVDEEPLDEIRSLARDQRDRLRRAEAVSGALDVRGEALGRVARRPRDDAALGVPGVGLRRLLGARHDRHGRAAAGRRESRRAAGDAGSEDEDVGGAGLAHVVVSSSEMSAARTECVSAPTETASAPASA